MEYDDNLNISISTNASIDGIFLTFGYWLLLFTNIISVLCSVFLLTLLLCDRTLRTALHNHLVIILLFVNLVSQLIDNPAYLSYLNQRRVWPSTPGTCILWILVAYQFYTTSTLIVALASIQRHILIFNHRQFLWTSKRRFFVHYLPIALVLIYSLAYGVVVMVLLIRDNYPFDYSARMCGGLANWILNYPALSMYDLFMQGLLPTPIIVLGSVGLLIRVLRQKHRMLHRIEWRKQRKLTIQLLSISCLFIVINLPPILIHITLMAGASKTVAGLTELHLFFGYLTYYQSILLPFACLFPLLSNIRTTLRHIVPMIARIPNCPVIRITPVNR